MPLAETNWVEQENSLKRWRIYQRMTSFSYIFEPSYDFYPMSTALCASFLKKNLHRNIIIMSQNFTAIFHKGNTFHIWGDLKHIKKT